MKIGHTWGGETFITSAHSGLGNVSKGHFSLAKVEVITACLADTFATIFWNAMVRWQISHLENWPEC